MKHKILIVDDDDAIRRVLTETLSGLSHVLSAADGPQALGLIERERPVLVFLDVKMPGISGLEVLRLVKESGLDPVIWMLTGEEDLDMAMKTFQLGAAGYLTKPFELERICEIAYNVIESRTGKEKRSAPVEKSWRVEKKTDGRAEDMRDGS